MASVVSFIRGQRIQQLGHMWRRNEDDMNRIVLEWKVTGKKLQKRPRKRWLDAEEDLDDWEFKNGENQPEIEKMEGFIVMVVIYFREY